MTSAGLGPGTVSRYPTTIRFGGIVVFHSYRFRTRPDKKRAKRQDDTPKSKWSRPCILIALAVLAVCSIAMQRFWKSGVALGGVKG